MESVTSMKIRRTPSRVTTATAAVALTAGLLVGCSSTSPSPSASSGGGGGTLRMLTYGDAGQSALMQTEFTKFEEQTGIKVTLDTIPGAGYTQFNSKLNPELIGGQGPDIWRMWGGTIGQAYADNGQAADLAKYYDQYKWGDLIDAGTINGMKWNGTIIGLPLYRMTLTAWYSKDAFAKAGITKVPTTYAELTADNEALVKSGQVPVGLGGKYGWDIMRLFQYLLEKDAGPTLHDQLLTGEADWNDPAVVKAFTELKEWGDNGWMPEGALGLDPADVEPGFTQGKSAYTIAGSWVDSGYIQKASDPSAYGTFALPTDLTPNRSAGWVEGFMINAASPNQDNAAKLLNFLAQPEEQKAIENSVSPVKGAEPDATKFPASAENTRIGAESPFFTQQDQGLPADVSNTYFDLQSQVMQGQVTPQDAAAKMQQAMASAKK